MKIIEIRNKKKGKDTVHVGVHLPKDGVDFLSLYCTAKGTNKSEVLRKMFDQWLKEKKKKEKYSIKNLSAKIVKSVLPQWEKIKHKKQRSIASFLTVLKIELTKKGVRDKHSDLIIEMIQDETDEA